MVNSSWNLQDLSGIGIYDQCAGRQGQREISARQCTNLSTKESAR